MMYRRLTVIACVLACAMTGTAAAQTVDEIVARNLEALGGRAALDRVQSIRQTSQLVLPGSEARIVIYAKRPNLIREEIRIAGQTVVQAFDGSTGWTLNRLVGATKSLKFSPLRIS